MGNLIEMVYATAVLNGLVVLSELLAAKTAAPRWMLLSLGLILTQNFLLRLLPRRGDERA